MLEIGTYLRKRRNEPGWSQEAMEALLKKVGMDKSNSQPNYSNWENGKALPSISQLYKLAEALETTPEYFLTGKVTARLDENGETQHWRTIAEERGERCTVEKKLIEKLEQENEALKKRVAELEERLKNGNI